jgi:hypothetical protein
MSQFSKTGRAAARIVGPMSVTGPLEGTSVADVLIAGREGYLASERVDGVMEGRRDESGARGTLSYALAARS